MKKIMLTGFVGMMLAVPAFATGEDEALTTKKYVDSGLRAVYQTSKGYTDTAIGTLPTQVQALTATINGNGTEQNPGLVSTVAGLKQQVDTLTLSDTDTTYDAGNGITIDENNNNAISITGLSGTTGANATKMYIYQNGSLTEMPVAKTWDTNFDFDPND